MSLSDLASLGTLASSVAVFVSLIYVGLQMRQNAKHTRSLIHQGRVERLVDIYLRTAEPAMAAAIISGNSGQPTSEAVLKYQFERYCWAMFMSLEDSFAQRVEGLLGDDQFGELKRGVAGVMSEEGVRRYWMSVRPYWGAARFGAFVDQIAASLPRPTS